MSRNAPITRVVALGLAVLGFIFSSTSARGAILVKKILFFEDDEVLFRSGTKRVISPLSKFDADPATPDVHDAVLKPSGWDANGSITLCSVIFDPAASPQYRMWYQVDSTAEGFTGANTIYNTVVAYAYSADGSVWTKPNLAAATGFHYPLGAGLTNNNIVLVGAGASAGNRSGCSVIYDPADSARKYKMIFTDWSDAAGDPGAGLNIAFSADGVSWTKSTNAAFPYNWSRIASNVKNRTVPANTDPVFDLLGSGGTPSWRIPLSMSTAMNVFIEPAHRENGVFIPKRYACYGAMYLDGPDGKMGWKRGMGKITSPYDPGAGNNFQSWSLGELIATTADFDADDVDFQNSPVLNYDGIYFCLNQLAIPPAGNPPAPGDVVPPFKDTTQIELMTSRDGRHWNRGAADIPVLPLGTWNPPANSNSYSTYKEFDSRHIYTSPSMVVGTNLRFYYGGYGFKTGIGFAQVETDRIAGIAADWTWVTATTNRILPTGQVTLRATDLTGVASLRINAAITGAGGWIRGEVVTPDGYPVTGFTQFEATSMSGNMTNSEVTWGSSTINGVAPRGDYLIRFYLYQATLYSVSFYDNNSGNSSPLSEWRLAHFGTSQSVGDTANGADPDGDGDPNLLEYAYGSSPTQPDAQAGLTLDLNPDWSRLRLHFNRINDPGLRYGVQGGNTLGLGAWTEIWSSTGAGNVFGPVTVEDVVPLSGTDKRFLRLQVTTP